jgi:hypothetical protein
VGKNGGGGGAGTGLRGHNKNFVLLSQPLLDIQCGANDSFRALQPWDMI